jgi:hypothetical protein
MTRVYATREVIRFERASLGQFAQEPFVERVHVWTDCPTWADYPLHPGLIIHSTSSGAIWRPACVAFFR